MIIAPATDSVCKVEQEDGFALLTLNDMSCKNALSAKLIESLSTQLEEIEKNDQIKCVILKGQKDYFSVGAHLKELQEYGASANTKDILHAWECVARFSKPIIVMIQGYCLGGGLELALMGDIIFADDSAVFGQPEITLNLIPGAGATQRLSKSLSKTQVMDICLSGRLLTANEAYTMGIISAVFEKKELFEKTLDYAKKLSSKDLVSLKLAKQAILKAYETPLSEGIRYERDTFYKLLKSSIGQKGIEDFFSKKKPSRN